MRSYAQRVARHGNVHVVVGARAQPPNLVVPPLPQLAGGAGDLAALADHLQALARGPRLDAGAVLDGAGAGARDAAAALAFLEQHREMLMAAAGETDAKVWADHVDVALENLPALAGALEPASASEGNGEEAALRDVLSGLPAGSPLAAHAERALETLLTNSRGWSLEQKRRHLERLVSEASSQA